MFIYLPFGVIAIHVLTRADCYGDAAAVERHLADFPYERELPAFAPRSAPSPTPQRVTA